MCGGKKITIGKNVIVGANCTIIDTDFHPLDPDIRQRSPRAVQTVPISIGDDVFIGMNCIILKAITIGQAAVVGAGSVVTHDIPAKVIVVGNPTRVVWKL